MKYITEEIEIVISDQNILNTHFQGMNHAILDIETTGLSPAYSQIILIGLITCSSSGEKNLYQFFAETPEDEEAILKETIKILKDIDYVITFNGKSFDLPFINKRLLKFSLNPLTIYNFDLFLYLKNYSDLPSFLSRMNQKALEEYAGISNLREDKISGEESLNLYFTYLENHSQDLERRILLHNNDDIKQLLRLKSLILNGDINRYIYNNGMPLKGAIIEKISLKKDDLAIKGLSLSPSEYISFPSPDNPYHFRMSGKDGSYELSLPIESLKDNSYVQGDNMLTQEELDLIPSVINGNIILKESGIINYTGINLLSKYLITKVLKEI